MVSDPRVLVVADDDARVAPLCEGLDALGWRTMTARGIGAATAAAGDMALDAVILDSRPASDAAALKLAALPRSLPILSLAGEDGPEVDLVMAGPPHPAQVALRLEQLFRAAVAEEEFLLRQATFAAHGATLQVEADAGRPLRVLAAGAPDRRFLGLSNALAASGAEVVAAPTPYTAFDYLHESGFDAAVLWGDPEHAPALSIASGMRRNTRLFHIPLVLYLRQAGEIDLEEVYRRGIADVAAFDAPEEDAARRVLALARTYRRHQALRRALDGARGSELMDPATGLFTPDLFAAHLARVAEAARARRRPASVSVLRVRPSDAVVAARDGGWLDRAMPQIGAMVARLVRAEDIAARLSGEVFALALPATSGPAARLAAERIAAVIGCTAFDAGPDNAPFVVDFDLGVAEMQAGESPAAVLDRASADLTLRRSTRQAG